MILSDWLILSLGELEFESKWCLIFFVLNLAFWELLTESNSFGTYSPFSCFCSCFCLLLAYFVIHKQSIELEQINPFCVHHSMTIAVIRDISCKPVGEISFYAVKYFNMFWHFSSRIHYVHFPRRCSSSCSKNTGRSRRNWMKFFGQCQTSCFWSFWENVWKIERINT